MTDVKRDRRVLILLLMILLTHAEAKEERTLLERLAQPKITFDTAYLSEANIKESSGSVKVAKNRFQINNAFAGFSYTNWSFDWDGVEALPFGDGVEQPIRHMHGLKFDVRVPYPISEQWFMLSSLSVKSTFEDEIDGSYGFGVFSFASYKIDDDHAVQMGFFANQHPVKTLILPALSYSYRARQKDGTTVILGFPRTYIGYFADQDTLIRFGFVYSQSVIRLSDESTIEPAGFMEAQDYMGNLGIAYDLDDDIELSADLLYSLKREFTLYDHQGGKLEGYDIEPSVGVQLRLKWLL